MVKSRDPQYLALLAEKQDPVRELKIVLEPIVTPIEAARAIEDELHAVSGKPVLVHKDPTVAGYASIKIASEDSPAHLLRYKPEFESMNRPLAVSCQPRSSESFPQAGRCTFRPPSATISRRRLQEQARIVSILNKFSTLTSSIKEGLPREIGLRQKQYEYYRDLLLSFPRPDEVPAFGQRP